MTWRPVGRAPSSEQGGRARASDPGCSPDGHGPPEPGLPPLSLPGRPHARAHRRRGAATAPDRNRPPAARGARVRTTAGTDLQAANPPGRTLRPRTPDNPNPEGPQGLAAGHVRPRGASGHPAAQPPPGGSHVTGHEGERPPPPPQAVAPDAGVRTGATRPSDNKPPPDTQGNPTVVGARV